VKELAVPVSGRAGKISVLKVKGHAKKLEKKKGQGC
jgi:hypothetical protein